MSSTNFFPTAEQEILLYENRRMKSEREPITFKNTGLIPMHNFLWEIWQWTTRGLPASFLTLEHIRSKKHGGKFARIEKTFGSRFIVKQNYPGTEKTLLGYMLDRDMTEGEILQSASDLGIRRLQLDRSGTHVINLNLDLSFSEVEKMKADKDVDAHDFYRIASMHTDGKVILPKNVNFHFFPDICHLDEESGKVKFTATHLSLRDSNEGLIASASRFNPNHLWKKGDICVFAPHERFRQKIR